MPLYHNYFARAYLIYFKPDYGHETILAADIESYTLPNVVTVTTHTEIAVVSTSAGYAYAIEMAMFEVEYASQQLDHRA